MNSTAIKSISALQLPWKTQDPFIFCSYHFDVYPGGNKNLGPSESLAGRNIGQDFSGKDGWSMYHGTEVPGFPAHPHAGFETVSIVTKGVVDHSDSLGGKGRFGNGDVQWLTSGKGVLHAEMFPLLNAEKNPFEIFQLWLNLPAKSKKVAPHYKMIWKEEIPMIVNKDEKELATTFYLIAGTLNNVDAVGPTPDSWAADPQNGVHIWRAELDPGATFIIDETDSELTQSLYFYEGKSLSINDDKVSEKSVIELLANKKKVVQNTSDEKVYLFFLQGKPMNDPVVQHGPFVANSQEEIRDIMHEYNRTQFGGWPYESLAPVHAQELGRFARFTDGTEEMK